MNVLRRHIDCPDEILRSQVLQSLSMCGYHAVDFDVPMVEDRIRTEVGHAAWKLRILNDLSPSPELQLLRSSLEGEVSLCRRRLFLLASFLGDSKVLLSARDNYFSGVKERRAYAIEVLDLTLPDALRPLVLPLLEDLPLAAQLDRLSRFFVLQPQSGTRHLHNILSDLGERTSAWTQAVAVRAVVAMEIPELLPLVREMASGEAIDFSSGDAADEVFRDAVRAETTAEQPDRGGIGTMYSTIERVIFLKGVPMFAGASEQILAEIASVVEEVHFEEGEAVFRKGDPGASMYVVISGRARVHDGQRTIVHLGDRDVFGEMAILDPEPRSADVTAVEATSLFRLDRDSFLELMADHVEIVTGVLHVICQRLRNATSGNRIDDRPPSAHPVAPAPPVPALVEA